MANQYAAYKIIALELLFIVVLRMFFLKFQSTRLYVCDYKNPPLNTHKHFQNFM